MNPRAPSPYTIPLCAAAIAAGSIWPAVGAGLLELVFTVLALKGP